MSTWTHHLPLGALDDTLERLVKATRRGKLVWGLRGSLAIFAEVGEQRIEIERLNAHTFIVDLCRPAHPVVLRATIEAGCPAWAAVEAIFFARKAYVERALSELFQRLDAL